MRFWQTAPYPSPNPRLTLTLRKTLGWRRGRLVENNKMNQYITLAICQPPLPESNIHYFQIAHNAPPTFCKTTVSNFSWLLQSSQEKSKTVVCMYGLCEKDELTPASLFGKIWVASQNLTVIFLTAVAHTT